MRRKFTFILLFATTLIFSQDRFRSGIFLHHSTGDLIWGNDQTGNTTDIPKEIDKYNSENNYTDDLVFSLKEKWFPNSTDNEWSYWRKVFNKEVNDDIYSIINSNKIVIIKSCFPSSEVEGWGEPADTLDPTKKTVYNYKWHWRYFLDSIKAHPETFFVIWTNAPKVNGYDSWAFWSNQFCTWAKDTLAKGLDPEYGEVPKNVYVFDYFHKLVGDNYKLKPEYAAGSNDSHPNGAATDLIAPQFVKEIFDAAVAYENYYNKTLEPPVLISPANNSTDILLDVMLDWEIVSTASSYHLQVAPVEDFSTTILDENVKDSNYGMTGELNTNTKYFWRVSSLDDTSESSWSDIWNFTTTVATKITETREDSFRAYPNPSKGNLNLWMKNGGADISIKVYNVLGQVVKIKEIDISDDSTITLDLNDLPGGHYFLNYTSGNVRITKKVLLIK